MKQLLERGAADPLGLVYLMGAGGWLFRTQLRFAFLDDRIFAKFYHISFKLSTLDFNYENIRWIFSEYAPVNPNNKRGGSRNH